MADIFDEIDEELKRDQFKHLWKRYGTIVMAAVAAIVLVVALRQGYTYWHTSQAEVSASAYQQALQSDDVVEHDPAWPVERWLFYVGAIPYCR